MCTTSLIHFILDSLALLLFELEFLFPFIYIILFFISFSSFYIFLFSLWISLHKIHSLRWTISTCTFETMKSIPGKWQKSVFLQFFFFYSFRHFTHGFGRSDCRTVDASSKLITKYHVECNEKLNEISYWKIRRELTFNYLRSNSYQSFFFAISGHFIRVDVYQTQPWIILWQKQNAKKLHFCLPRHSLKAW